MKEKKHKLCSVGQRDLKLAKRFYGDRPEEELMQIVGRGNEILKSHGIAIAQVVPVTNNTYKIIEKEKYYFEGTNKQLNAEQTQKLQAWNDAYEELKEGYF